jgi:hypothetical protein
MVAYGILNKHHVKSTSLHQEMTSTIHKRETIPVNEYDHVIYITLPSWAPLVDVSTPITSKVGNAPLTEAC